MTGRGRGPDGAARARILVEASRLFAERGFHGTSTRDIASAVGVRQPTLYSHFDSKHAILAALLDADLLPARGRVRAALDIKGPAAARLHALLVADVSAILCLPYDVRGFYNDAVLQMPQLATQSTLRAELHALTTDLVSGGVETGEFLEVEPDFVRGAITGLMLQAVSERGAEPAPAAEAAARRIADFVVRAVLADPANLPQVQAASAEIVERVGRPEGDASTE